MTRFKVALLGYRKEWEQERLKENAPAGMEVVGLPSGADESQVSAAVLDSDVIVLWGTRPTAETLRSAPRLKLVQSMGAGVDLQWAVELAEFGLPVASNAGANSVAVAEHTVMLMVAAARGLESQVREVRAGRYREGLFERWDEAREIAGRRVGIVGLGHIGFNVARRLSGWDCEIVYHDILPMSAERERAANATRVGLDELLRTSDIVTLHAPLTPGTRGMIGRRELDLMKNTALLVNTSRGAVIDEPALIDVLKARRIKGAALDVTEAEPIPAGHPLLALDNVVLTPHAAMLAIESLEKSLDFALRNAVRVMDGKKPQAIVTPA